MATDSARAEAPSPDLFHERRASRRGATIVAGVDEVGRGPLAGPVVAAAVILNRRWIPDGLNDSKQLSADDRARIHDELVAHSTVAVVAAPTAIIAELNILWAAMWAMRRAVMSLTIRPDYVLIDGNTAPRGMPCTIENVVGGDARSLSIAAASVVAKVTRDRMCEIMHCEEPHFGFANHKGYSAPPHFRALEAHGPGRYHRMDFAPCIEADTRLRTGIAIGPLIPEGWTRPAPKPQLDLFAADILAYSHHGFLINLSGARPAATLFFALSDRSREGSLGQPQVLKLSFTLLFKSPLTVRPYNQPC